jgi:hypothetical protein
MGDSYSYVMSFRPLIPFASTLSMVPVKSADSFMVGLVRTSFLQHTTRSQSQQETHTRSASATRYNEQERDRLGVNTASQTSKTDANTHTKQ